MTTTTSTHAAKMEQRAHPQTTALSLQSPPHQSVSKPSPNLGITQQSVKPPDPLQMMSSMQQPAAHSMSMGQMAASPHPTHQHSSKSSHGQGQGRIGSVMQVRCKSLGALLYVNKYESGSKGKCLLVGEDWMTPNEFEEKAGSKAKKYLSSIKCLGRPLRAYVNSGELRGSGPTPSPKPPKISKPKPPQQIAPAPAPGQSPAHMLASNMIPPSLTQVAMIGLGSVGQPILLNQSNLAVSIAGQSSMNQV